MQGNRDAALTWASSARIAREKVRSDLREGRRELESVLRDGSADEYLGTVWLLWVLESRPGVRKIDTRRQLASLGIDPSTELADLDPTTVELLIEHFGKVST